MTLIVTTNFKVLQHSDAGSKVINYVVGQKLTAAQTNKLTPRQIIEYTNFVSV